MNAKESDNPGKNHLATGPLRGIVVPLVTPLNGRDELDEPGLERLIEHVLDGGVAGVFILGTTGEAPALGYDLRGRLIDRVCRQVGGRATVLVGVTDTAFVETLRIAERAMQAGAAAAVLSAPYYFPSSQPELLEYLEHLVPRMPLPVFLYNMPSLTKVTFAPDTVERASKLPNVIGLKDSSADMVYFHYVYRLIHGRDDFTLMTGPEELLVESVLLGGHGGVNGGANLFPRIYVGAYEAAASGDLQRARVLHEWIIDVSAKLYRVGRHGSSYLKGLKCALACSGLCSDYMAEPFHRFRSAEQNEVKERLENIRSSLERILG